MAVLKSVPKHLWYLGAPTYFFDLSGAHAREVEERHFVEDGDGQFEVTVHVGMVDQRLAVIGVDVRSFVLERGKPKPIDPRQAFSSVKSQAWRSLPIGDLADRAIEYVQARYREMSVRARKGAYHRDASESERIAQVQEELANTPANKGRRPGPAKLLTDDVLRTVVAQAYEAGGSRPVVAVQEALNAFGHNKGRVTIDQARKAVQGARRLGAIPPANKRSRGNQ